MTAEALPSHRDNTTVAWTTLWAKVMDTSTALE